MKALTVWEIENENSMNFSQNELVELKRYSLYNIFTDITSEKRNWKRKRLHKRPSILLTVVR